MTGFNTDVHTQGDHYHVQTQVTRAGVETLVYMGGQVVYARRAEGAGDKVAPRQHQSIVESLEEGSLDLFVGDEEIEVLSLAESLRADAESGEGVFARMADFVRRYKQRHLQPPSFWIDAHALRQVAVSGSGPVTARLAHAGGQPVAGAMVEIERFELFGPSTRLTAATTDKDGSLTFDCHLGQVRPAGLMLRSEWHGDETTARFLV